MGRIVVLITARVKSGSKSYYLDTIEDTSVSSEIQLTPQPLPTGDTITDHYYLDPKTMTISGELSLNGNTYFSTSGALINNTLAYAQEEFEQLQKEGVLCTISKLNYDNKNTPLFKKRSNMVLKSISWTEKINSVSFTFTFHEVLSPSVTTVDADEGELYPYISEANPVSFSLSILNVDDTWANLIMKIILQYGDEDVWYCFTNALDAFFGRGFGYGLIGGAAGAIVGTKIAPGWGTLIAAIFGSVIGTGISVYQWAVALQAEEAEINKFYDKYTVYSWKTEQYPSAMGVGYRSERVLDIDKTIKKMQETLIPGFYERGNELYTKLRELDEYISAYQFTSYSVPQEVGITMNNRYFIFKVERFYVKEDDLKTGRVKNVADYSVNIYENGVRIGGLSSLRDGAPRDFGLCNSNSAILKLADSWLFIVCKKDGERDKLENYYLVNSGIKPEEMTTVITNIIRSMTQVGGGT